MWNVVGVAAGMRWESAEELCSNKGLKELDSLAHSDNLAAAYMR